MRPQGPLVGGCCSRSSLCTGCKRLSRGCSAGSHAILLQPVHHGCGGLGSTGSRAGFQAAVQQAALLGRLKQTGSSAALLLQAAAWASAEVALLLQRLQRSCARPLHGPHSRVLQRGCARSQSGPHIWELVLLTGSWNLVLLCLAGRSPLWLLVGRQAVCWSVLGLLRGTAADCCRASHRCRACRGSRSMPPSQSSACLPLPPGTAARSSAKLLCCASPLVDPALRHPLSQHPLHAKQIPPYSAAHTAVTNTVSPSSSVGWAPVGTQARHGAPPKVCLPEL